MNNRKPKKVSEIERQYVAIVGRIRQIAPANYAATLQEQPENVAGENFTTYGVGEISRNIADALI